MAGTYIPSCSNAILTSDAHITRFYGTMPVRSWFVFFRKLLCPVCALSVTRGLSCDPCQRAGRFKFNIFWPHCWGRQCNALYLWPGYHFGKPHKNETNRDGWSSEDFGTLRNQTCQMKALHSIANVWICKTCNHTWTFSLFWFIFNCMYCLAILRCTKRESSEYVGGGVFYRETGSSPSAQHTTQSSLNC